MPRRVYEEDERKQQEVRYIRKCNMIKLSEEMRCIDFVLESTQAEPLDLPPRKGGIKAKPSSRRVRSSCAK